MYNSIFYDFLKINRKRTNRPLKWSAVCLTFFMSYFGFAQNVTIPDANFKDYLLNNSLININGDEEIQASEAEAFAGTISCSFSEISDLTGIEAFVNLTELDCSFNQLTTLDISKNTNLKELDSSANQLTAIDVSNNIDLEVLNCSLNQLATLDISNNTNLKELDCSVNRLTTIDVSNNTDLEVLNCFFELSVYFLY